MKRKNSKIIGFIIGAIVLVILVVLFILDYNDLLNGHKLNMEFWAVTIQSFITIVLFYITYKYINKREIQKNENAKMVAREMLINTYKSVEESMGFFENPSIFNIIRKSVDYDNNFSKNETIIRLLEIPFTFDKDILKFATDGVLSGEEFNQYLDIKKKYSLFVTNSVTFSDVKTLVDCSKNDLMKALDKMKNKYNWK